LCCVLQETLQRIFSQAGGSDIQDLYDNLKRIHCRVLEMETTKRNNTMSIQKHCSWMRNEILQFKRSETLPIGQKYHRFVVHFVGGWTNWSFVFLTRQG
jgi:hypothetical protein